MPLSRSESVLSFSRVAASILANAASVGANTVSPGLLFRVSTRFTFGLSLPDSAEVSVLSIGLLDAATATGSCAMPATDPGPLGTCSAYAAHPVPTRLAPGLAIGLGATEVVAAIAVVLVVAASGDAGSLEHAAAPKIATAVRAAAAIAF